LTNNALNQPIHFPDSRKGERLAGLYALHAFIVSQWTLENIFLPGNKFLLGIVYQFNGGRRYGWTGRERSGSSMG
jgi:hypothetical protein